MVKRETTVRALYEEYAKPAPLSGSPIPEGLTDIQFAGEVLRREHKAGSITIGGTSKLLSTLHPEHQRRVLEVAGLYDYQVDGGRHGRPKDVTDAFEIDPEVTQMVHEGLSNDYVANELMNRRGNDSDLPLPDITRRDVLGAAFDASNSSQEE
jgi:hypothetical protein